MKILLLTDIPPCKNLTAGLVLDQLCRFLPKGSIACFAVVSQNLDAKLSEDLEWISIEYCKRPRESWSFRINKIGKLTSLLMENSYSILENRKIAEKAIKFGRNFGADVVWCILEGQTMIRLALPVSKGLGVPLLTEVWDPPFWWLRANGVDKFSKHSIIADFEQAMRNSAGCAAASWAMAEKYNHEYGTRTTPVIPSLDSKLAIEPAKEIHPENEFTIGMAGQIYASEEWSALIRALDSLSWEIGGRRIKIRLMGRYANLLANGKMHIEFLGWRSQEDTISLMANCDILYCPYWFDPAFENEARLSFPSKLTSYLAAGRPVLFHGPQYASPARFLIENNAGLCCHSLDSQDIVKALKQLSTDNELYTTISHNGSLAFNKFLTLPSMRKSFADFLQVNEDWLLPVDKNS